MGGTVVLYIYNVNEMKKINVHVADDHKVLVDGISAVINTDKDIEICGYSLTGQEVIDWFSKKRNKSDVLILDITMPINDGFDVLRYFKEKRIYQKVIIFSSYDDLKIVQEALNLGCYGYVTKKSASEHILDAIKTVAKGEQYFSDDIKNILLKTFTNQVTETGDLPDKIIIESLTDRELEVLKYIAYEYNSAEIAEKMNLSVSTIDTYRKSLLKKLKVKNSVGIAMYAVRNKLI